MTNIDKALRAAAKLCPALPADVRGTNERKRGPFNEFFYVDPELIRSAAWDALDEVGLAISAESWEVDATSPALAVTVHFRAVLFGEDGETVESDTWSVVEPFDRDLANVTHSVHAAVRMIETRFLETRLRIRRIPRGARRPSDAIDPNNMPPPPPRELDPADDIPEWPEPEITLEALGEPWGRLCQIEGHPTWARVAESATGHKPPLEDVDAPAMLAEIERLLALRVEQELAVDVERGAEIWAPPAQAYMKKIGGRRG